MSDLKGKRVLAIADLKVPLDDNLKITDDTRIPAAVPTIKYSMIHDILSGDLKFNYVVGALENTKKPFAAIVGGSTVSSKSGVILSLLEEYDVDIILLGGGMTNTFFKAKGMAVGSSPVEEDELDLAASLMERAKTKEVTLLLPTDVVIADKFSPDANSKIVLATAIPDGWMGLDIGPDAIKTFNKALDITETIFWNGPMGEVEFDKFAAGTESIAKKLLDLSGKGVTTIIEGGDTVAAVKKVGFANKMSHISTGDGASLELLEGNPLPGVHGTAHRAHSSTERVVKFFKSTAKKCVSKVLCCLLSEAVCQVVDDDALDNDA